MRKLLNHVVSLLVEPNIAHISSSMLHVFNLWLNENGYGKIEGLGADTEVTW
jgi:hypothetical protein